MAHLLDIYMEILKEFGLTQQDIEALNAASIKVSSQAYCPYSDVHVGAALLTCDNQIITACNYENVSYRATICAESTCIAKANTMGHRKFKAISVHINKTGMTAYPMPCGICRQVMVEFGFFPVFCCKTPTNYIIKTTSSMLPYALRAFSSGKDIFSPSAKDINQILDTAHYYLTTDFCDETRQEVEDLIHTDDFEGMRKIFCKRIDFGTAGLRGKMGAGYSNMNFVTVQQAAQGLGKYLIECFGKDKCKTQGIVIGYDGRHNSKQFAHLSAAVFTKLGLKAILFESYNVTPMVPYYITHFHTLAGVMVTASHNPKQDNGYKVYWENGAQIIEPHDRHIRELICQNLDMLDLTELFDYNKREVKFDIGKNREIAIASYIDSAMSKYKVATPEMLAKCKPITFTPIHGVGYHLAEKMFSTVGFKNIVYVKEQIVPDPEFTTVYFPNPEEGEPTFRLSMKTADENGSTLVLACDPDADRMGVAEKQKDGKWKIFTGDEIGTILASFLIENYKGDISKAAMVASTVSSKMIKKMAEVHKFKYEETLTGFKWIENKVMELEKAGYDVIFSYEEAIGYCLGSMVRDKDGVNASTYFAQLYAKLCIEGKTVQDYLDSIYAKYGYFLTKNKYYLCYDPTIMKSVFDNFRNNGNYPKKLGTLNIANLRDLTVGYDDRSVSKVPNLPTSASTQMITFYFDNGAICTLRGSGTEPKLKYYIESNGPNKDETLKTLLLVHKEIVECFLLPEKHKLIAPSE